MPLPAFIPVPNRSTSWPRPPVVRQLHTVARVQNDLCVGGSKQLAWCMVRRAVGNRDPASRCIKRQRRGCERAAQVGGDNKELRAYFDGIATTDKGTHILRRVYICASLYHATTTRQNTIKRAYAPACRRRVGAPFYACHSNALAAIVHLDLGALFAFYRLQHHQCDNGSQKQYADDNNWNYHMFRRRHLFSYKVKKNWLHYG